MASRDHRGDARTSRSKDEGRSFAPLVPSTPAVRIRRRYEAVAHALPMRQDGLAALSPRLALVTLGSAAITPLEDSAGQLFEEALGAPGDGWPFDLARVRLALSISAGPPRLKIARTQLRAALDGFEVLGARSRVSRASGEPRASGQFVPAANGPSTSPPHASEAEDRRAGRHRCYRQDPRPALYLSDRTVGAHRHHIFPSSRLSPERGWRTLCTLTATHYLPRSTDVSPIRLADPLALPIPDRRQLAP